MAWHCTTAVYNAAACVVVLWPQSFISLGWRISVDTTVGHWLWRMPTGRKKERLSVKKAQKHILWRSLKQSWASTGLVEVTHCRLYGYRHVVSYIHIHLELLLILVIIIRLFPLSKKVQGGRWGQPLSFHCEQKNCTLSSPFVVVAGCDKPRVQAAWWGANDACLALSCTVFSRWQYSLALSCTVFSRWRYSSWSRGIRTLYVLHTHTLWDLFISWSEYRYIDYSIGILIIA